MFDSNSPLLPPSAAGTTLAAPESHAQVRAQQDRNQRLDQALDKPQMRSPRWASTDPETAASAALVRRQSLRGPAEAVAAADAVAAQRQEQQHWQAAMQQEAAQQQQQQQQQQQAPVPLPSPPAALDPALEAAADQLGTNSSVSPMAPLDRYDSAPSRSSVDLQESAGQEEEHQDWQLGSPQRSGSGDGREGGGGGAAPPAGPPDLGTLSADPSVNMERYAAALARPSVTPGPGSVPQMPAERLPAAPGMRGPPQHHARFQPQPDLLASDLTATASVPMNRYAAMVAADEEEEGEGGSSGGGYVGGYGGGGGGDDDDGGATFPPARHPRPSTSWHNTRSLANLAAIVEAEEGRQSSGELAGSPG